MLTQEERELLEQLSTVYNRISIIHETLDGSSFVEKEKTKGLILKKINKLIKKV